MPSIAAGLDKNNPLLWIVTLTLHLTNGPHHKRLKRLLNDCDFGLPWNFPFHFRTVPILYAGTVVPSTTKS
jgi:hypothetical protein